MSLHVSKLQGAAATLHPVAEKKDASVGCPGGSEATAGVVTRAKIHPAALAPPFHAAAVVNASLAAPAGRREG